MSNRIGRLELLFWFVSSILGGGILLAIVASFTNTAIELGRTREGKKTVTGRFAWAFSLVLALRRIVSEIGYKRRAGWAPNWSGH